MILMVSALDEELQYTVAQLRQVEVHVLEGLTVYRGELNGQSAAAAAVGSGKVHASIYLSLMLKAFSPERMYGIGLCGAVDNFLKIGQLVHIVSSVQYDLDIGRFGLRLGEINGSLPDCIDDTLDVQVISTAQSVIGGTADRFLTADYVYAHPELQDVLNLQSADMESYAWMAAASVCKTPCRIFRVVSDTPGERPENFKKFLRQSSRQLYEAVFLQEKMF
jgi:nucleoside phosphorylase